MNEEFLQKIANILENARKMAKTAVNLSMVYAYYEIGENIILEEQNSDDRAEYGKQILKGVSEYLTEKLQELLNEHLQED